MGLKSGVNMDPYAGRPVRWEGKLRAVGVRTGPVHDGGQPKYVPISSSANTTYKQKSVHASVSPARDGTPANSAHSRSQRLTCNPSINEHDLQTHGHSTAALCLYFLGL